MKIKYDIPAILFVGWMTMIVLLIIIYSSRAYAQGATYTETKLFQGTIISGSTVQGLGAFTTSTGFAIQTDIDCAAACTVNTTLGVSLDGVNYQLIPEFTKTYTATQTVVFNIYSQFYKYFRLDVTEVSGNPATVTAMYSTKGQL